MDIANRKNITPSAKTKQAGKAPRQYKPKILNHYITAKEYTLFFNHLEKVISQKQISAKLEKGALQSIAIRQMQKEIHQLYSEKCLVSNHD